MLGRTNLFNDIPCPYYASGQCTRPYCHYKHQSAVPVEENTIVEYVPPSYSTVPAVHFLGYQGFFELSSSNSVIHNDSMSTKVEQIANVASNGSSYPSYSSSSMGPSYSSSPSTVSVPQQQANINELAKNLASINNAIRELQNKLATHNNNDEQEAEESGGFTYGHEEYEPEEPKRPSSKSKHAKNEYKPTPIDELQKLKKSKKNSGLVAKNDAKYEPSSKKKMKCSKTEESSSTAMSIVDDLLNDTKSKKPMIIAKKNHARPRELRSFDLFGENSSEEDKKPATKRKSPLASSSTGAKGKCEVFVSSTVDEEPPLSKKAKINVGKQRLSDSEIEVTSSSSVLVDTSKKRVARIDNSETVASLRQLGGERSRPKANFLTPREQLKMRFEQMQKQKAEILSRNGNGEGEKTKLSTTSATSRIVDRNSKETTVAITAIKGEKRIAHIPLKSVLKRPTIAVDIGSKIPTAIRQRYLNLFIDECLKFCKTEEDAFNVGLEHEKNVFNKATSKAGYLNAAVNAIKRLRDEMGLKSAFDGLVDVASTSASTGVVISHESVVGGKNASKYSFTVGRQSCGGSALNALEGRAFYDRLLEFVLTEQQLEENGFPCYDVENPGNVVFKKESSMKIFVDDWDPKRCCCRCAKMFQINAEGQYLGSDDCCYHWGKSWKRRIAGVLDSRFTCCQGDFNSKGCCLAKCHVTEMMPKRSLENYVETMGSQNSQNDNPGVYALDCEMVYTTAGCELARVTVVDDQLTVVYERIVKPESTLLDCNSRFSGLTEADVLGSSFSLYDVQLDLLKIFNADTILLGHSLESDLKALKMIHKKVVDTSVVFPHNLGGKYKRALKTLMIEYLEKIIQDDVDGHDSKEDACACMELMKWKIKNANTRKT